MENLLTLRQASKMTGYHPDYLSFLIRSKKLFGKKIGRTWCVNEEEVKNFIRERKDSGQDKRAARENRTAGLPAFTKLFFRWTVFAVLFIFSFTCVRLMLWPEVRTALFSHDIAAASNGAKVYASTKTIVTYYSDQESSVASSSLGVVAKTKK